MLHFQRVFRKLHYSSCPRYENSEESLALMMKIVPPAWLLAHTIQISVVLKNWSNSRGFSMLPVVIGTSRLVDAENSPGFQIMQRYENILYEDQFEDSKQFVVSLEEALKVVLDAGQSSVFDEDRNGNTLLYVRGPDATPPDSTKFDILTHD
jgi:hypothetical protein